MLWDIVGIVLKGAHYIGTRQKLFLLVSGLTVPHAIPFFPDRIVPDPLAPLLPGAYCLEAGSFEMGRKSRGGKKKSRWEAGRESVFLPTSKH